MRSPDKSGRLVKNARNGRLHYIKHRRLRKRSGAKCLPSSGTFPWRTRNGAYELALQSFRTTLVVAACKRGATRETRCRDKSMASPYNRVSGICMCLPLALKIFPSSWSSIVLLFVFNFTGKNVASKDRKQEFLRGNIILAEENDFSRRRC